MKNEWHIPRSGWRVAYPTMNRGVFLMFHTDYDIIHVSVANSGVEVKMIDIPKDRLNPGQWSMLMHLLQLAIEGEYEHD